VVGLCRGAVITGVLVSEAALADPRTSPRTTTVAQARRFFADDHVHALLVVHRGRLLSVVERDDLAGVTTGGPVWPWGRLAGRTVAPDTNLSAAHAQLVEEGRRRLAVVDRSGVLRGLLCLKASRSGFCSDADVRARAVERETLSRSS
jgi:CBS domain-containing protein